MISRPKFNIRSSVFFYGFIIHGVISMDDHIEYIWIFGATYTNFLDKILCSHHPSDLSVSHGEDGVVEAVNVVVTFLLVVHSA